MSLLVVVDIDGTIADGSKRFRKAGPEPDRANREEYLAWLKKIMAPAALSSDIPVPGAAHFLFSLKSDSLIYLTSREEQHRQRTAQWLSKYGFPYRPLIMRPNDDWRSSAQFKGDVLRVLKQMHRDRQIITLDDDNKGDCAPMYKELGIVHFKCMWNVNDWEAV